MHARAPSIQIVHKIRPGEPVDWLRDDPTYAQEPYCSGNPYTLSESPFNYAFRRLIDDAENNVGATEDRLVILLRQLKWYNTRFPDET